MVYYRCKCGKSESWGSMPPNRCASCSSCRSNLSSHPAHHQDPEPHDFSHEEIVQTDDGDKILTLCRWCFRTRSIIAEQGG